MGLRSRERGLKSRERGLKSRETGFKSRESFFLKLFGNSLKNFENIWKLFDKSCEFFGEAQTSFGNPARIIHPSNRGRSHVISTTMGRSHAIWMNRDARTTSFRKTISNISKQFPKKNPNRFKTIFNNF